MKAVLIKEVKENLKWVITIPLGIGVIWALLFLSAYERTGFLLPFMILGTISSFAAGIFGYHQMEKEYNYKQWGNVMLRPVTPSRVFFKKITAGFLMYFIMGVLPLLILLLWFRVFGHASEFDTNWYTSEQKILLVPVFMWIPLYLIGFLAGVRKDYWLTGRISAGFFGLFMLNVFWFNVGPSLLLIIIFSVIVFVAAWGNFITRGKYHRQNGIFKAAFQIWLFFNLTAMAVLCLSAAILFCKYRGIIPVSRDRSWCITKKGEVLTCDFYYYRGKETTYNGRLSGAWGEWTDAECFDLEGKEVEVAPEDIQKGYSAYSYYCGQEPTYFNEYPLSFGSSLNSKEQDKNGHKWIYMKDKGRIFEYIPEGDRTGLRIGPKGFASKPGEKVGRFKGSLIANRDMLNSTHIVVFPHSIYRIDFAPKEVNNMLSLSGDKKIRGIVFIPNLPYDLDKEREVRPIFFAAEINGKFLFYSLKEDRRLFKTEVRRDPENSTISKIDNNTGNFFITYRFWGHNSLSVLITEVDQNGNIVNEAELNDFQVQISSISGLFIPPGCIVTGYIYEHISSEPYEYDLPLRLPFVDNYSFRTHEDGEQYYWYPQLMIQNLPKMFFAASAIVGLICAIFGVVLMKKYAYTRTALAGWAVAIFLLGPLGLLLLLLLCEYPALETCPSCGKKRVVTRETCEHCGAEFSRSDPDGTEIFGDI